jgi:cytochrome P450
VIAPIEIAGISLNPGDTIFLFLGMANVQQGNGLVFDYQQKSSILTPTEMFTFGKGTHRCLGQALSIMEMEMSLKYLAESSLLEKKEIRSVEFERLSNIDVGNYGFTHLVFSTAAGIENEDKDEKKNSYSNSAKRKIE